MIIRNYKYLVISLFSFGVLILTTILLDNDAYSEDSDQVKNTSSYESLLSLDLVDFKLEEEEDSVRILWTTLSENHRNGFELERSENGLDFNTVRKIKNIGQSNEIIDYSIADKNKFNHVVYYRLKQINEIGKIDYSEIISFQSQKPKLNCRILINPNPCLGRCDIRLQDCYNEENSVVSINLYDIVGNVICTSLPTKIANGEAEIIYDTENYLNSAVYIIRGTVQNKTVEEKLIINN